MLKSLGLGKSKPLDELVNVYLETPDDKKEKKEQLWLVRDAVERKKSPIESMKAGITPVFIKALSSKDEEIKLWAFWVMRHLAENETAATQLLQEDEAISAIVSAPLGTCCDG